MWPECNRISLYSTCSGNLRLVEMRQQNFVVRAPKFTGSFSSTREGLQLIMRFFCLSIISIRSGDIHDRSPKLSEIAHTVDFGYVKMRQLYLMVSGQKFTKSRCRTRVGLYLITPFCASLFRRYSRSNSEVVQNRAKFRMFWPSQISGGWPLNLYPNCPAGLAARHVEVSYAYSRWPQSDYG